MTCGPLLGFHFLPRYSWESSAFQHRGYPMRKSLCLALIGLVSLACASATTAQQKANTAQQKANTAQQKANTAQQTANTTKQKANDPTRWEKNIAAFEAQDR